MRTVGIAVLATLGFVVVVALVIGLWAGGLIFQEKTANFRGRVAATNAIQGNGQYRIAAYNHFFDLCASVQDDEVTITAQKQELASSPSSGRAEQIHANLSALRSSRGEKINQYNADARKDGTAGQFRSSGLPFQLDSTQERTTCIA